MGKKRDYTKFSKDLAENQNGVLPEVEEVVEEEIVRPRRHMVGTVAGCNKLNVRSEPSTDTEVVGVLVSGEKVEVEEDAKDGFYKICTAYGLEGYCMEQYLLTYYEEVN